MCADLSKNVANGIDNNKFTYAQAKEACESLVDGMWVEYDDTITIFEGVDKNTQIDQAGLLDIVASAKRTDAGNINEEDITIFFNMLDTSGDGILTQDELSVISSDGKITDFSIWNSIDVFTPEKVSTYSKDYSSISTKGDDADELLSRIEDVFGKDSEEYKKAQAAIENGEENVLLERKDIDDFESGELEKIAQKIKDGDASLSDYEDLLTEDAYKALKSAVDDLNNADDDSGDDSGNGSGDVPDDGTGTPSAPTGTTTGIDPSKSTARETGDVTNAEEHSQYDELALGNTSSNIEDAIDGIGSDFSKIKSILEDGEYTADDIVAIVDAWEEQYGKDGAHLLEKIEDQWANSDDVQKLLAEKLTEAALSGNEAAAEMLAIQIKSGTADDLGTADKFLEVVFAQFDKNPELLYDVIDKYPGGHTALKDHIKNDYKGGFLWLGVNETGQGYLDIIDKHLNKKKKET